MIKKSDPCIRIRFTSRMVHPHGYYAIYLAEKPIACKQCGVTIETNTFFRYGTLDRRRVNSLNPSFPHCRDCISFDLYSSENRERLLERNEEYLYLHTREEFKK